MKIQVTKVDILNGYRCCPYNCPIARAITRTYNYKTAHVIPGVGRHGVGVVTICSRIFKLPAYVNKFALAFDKGKEVEPFEFELDTEGIL